MVRTQVQLGEEQVRALRARAAREQVSMSAIVRRALDTYLAEEASGVRAETRARALALIGRFEGGAKDVSTRHDAYLAEAFHA